MFSKSMNFSSTKELLINAINKYRGYKRCLQTSDISPDLKDGEFVEIQNKYFINKIVEKNKKLNISKKVSFVSGWVPYFKNKTSVLIYNFFSVNYSIRRNLILKISIIKNHKTHFCKFMSLKQYDILELGNEFFDDLSVENGILVVQVYNPMIPKNHGNGQFRFWAKYYNEKNNYLSTVHSMPLNSRKFNNKKLYGRNYFPNHKYQKNKNINASLEFNDIKVGNKGFCLGGYNMVLDQKDNPLAIWHMGPAYNEKNKTLKINKHYHCLWIPKGKNLNPRIVVDNKETFLEDNQDQILKVSIIREDKVIDEKELKFNKFFEESINDIFGKKFEFDYIIFLEFYSKLFSYLQVNYDNEDVGDQVHTHRANFFYDNFKNLNFFEELEEKNCRKFMHIYFNDNEYVNYLVLHNTKIKNKSEKHIKIRYFDENQKEDVKNITVDDKNIIKIFNLNTLFRDMMIKSNLNKAIIQLESKDYNFDATLLCHNQKNDKIAIDHLTGG